MQRSAKFTESVDILFECDSQIAVHARVYYVNSTSRKCDLDRVANKTRIRYSGIMF